MDLRGNPSDPVVGPDGTIYVVIPYGEGSPLVAISPEGEEKWRLKVVLDGTTPWEPVRLTVFDGGLYIASANNKRGSVEAVSTQGVQRWRVRGPNTFGPRVFGPDGTVYFERDNSMHALTPDGATAWSVDVGKAKGTYALALHNGTLYRVTYQPNSLQALSLDGKVKWALTEKGWYRVGPDGSCYLSVGSTISAFTAAGERKWTLDIPSEDIQADVTEGRLALGQGGAIYLGGNSRSLLAVDAKGQIAWQRNGLGKVVYPRMVGDDGTVYVRADKSLYAFAPDGSIRWQSDIGFAYGEAESENMVVAPSGAVFIAAVAPKSGLFVPKTSSDSGTMRHALGAKSMLLMIGG